MNNDEQNFLSISNLSKSFGGGKKALKRVTLQLKYSGVVGLLGPNGSGKTTLIKVLNGLYHKYTGEIEVNGKPLGVYSRKAISYLPDEVYFSEWMFVKDIVKYFDDLYDDFDRAKAEELLERLALMPKMKIKTLSKGMKERLQLVLVMSRKAKIYILDEPIGGVDPATRELILEIIIQNAQADSLVLISTHLISDIETIFDEVIFLKEGEVLLHKNAKELVEESGKSINEIFKEEFKC
ncbi:MAG: ABC transporter ATP-binding protein [Anaerorhabdus sp.]